MDIETILTTLISGSIGAILAVVIGYMTFREKLESRLKDLEHKIESLDQFKNIIERVGLDQVEKVFREEEGK